MSGRPTSRAVRLAERLFALLQRLLPGRRWRGREREARELFRQLADEARARRGIAGVVAVLARSTGDLLRWAPSEHRASRRRARPWRLRDWPPTLAADLRFALRANLARPRVAAIVIVTLALGIGANTAIFSVVRGVLLRELPFPEAQRLVRFQGYTFGEFGRGTIAWADFDDVRSRARAFAAAAAYDEWQTNLGGIDGGPERIDAATVSAAFFDVLGVQPAVGRFFRPEEDVDGRDRVIVLSYGLWQRRFGGDPDVIGSTVLLNGSAHEIIGVAPADFEDPLLSGVAWGKPALWRPLGFGGLPAESLPSRGSTSYTAIARLAPGVSLAAAQSEVDSIYASLQQEFPDQDEGREARLQPLQESMVGGVRQSLLLLLGTVAFVLGIAAVNVAGVLLGRAAERRRESAVRRALGAGRGRLVQLFLAEGLLLALIGGVLGALLARLGTETLVGMAGNSLPRADAVHVDGLVLLVTAAVSVATGLLCGLVPALRFVARDASAELATGGRSATASRAQGRLRSLLVAAEVALAITLVVGAGLFLRSLWSLNSVDPGLDPANVLVFELAPSSADVAFEDVVGFYGQLLDGIRGLPGVEDAAAVALLPLAGSFDGTITWDEAGPAPDRQDALHVEVRTVTPGYFRVMGIELLRGRALESSDGPDSARVAVVNRRLAEALWPGADPLGRQLHRGDDPLTVVGVVEDVHELSLEGAATPAYYVAHAQGIVPWQTRRMKVVARTNGDPRALIPGARNVVAGLAPEVPIAKARPMRELIAGSIAQPRFRTVLLGTFAALALALSAVGIYGVVSFHVVQRRRGMAIRMALGASDRRVVGEVVRSGMTPVVAGTALGLVAAAALGRGLAGMLYGVTPLDPPTLASAALGLLAVAALAAWLPALRVSRIDLVGMLGSD